MKIAITGSNGFIGQALVKALRSNGDEVLPIVRKAIPEDHILWDLKKETIDFETLNASKIDAVVHLAGEGIAEKKWTPEQKREILDSRIRGTRLISETISKLDKKPSIFISASAIGFYGDRADEQLDEKSIKGDTFQSQVCVAWEENVEPARESGIPTAIIRTGIENKFEGIFNLTAPEPVTNLQFTKALGKRVSRPTILPTPLFGLKAIYGSELVGELLLGSVRAMPKALEDAGFKFEHETLDQAFKDGV